MIAVRTDGDVLDSFAEPSRDVAAGRNGVLSVSFDNPSDGDAVFAFRGEMVAFGVSPAAAPVPEPETYALMLVGLAGRRSRGTTAPLTGHAHISASAQIVRAQFQP